MDLHCGLMLYLMEAKTKSRYAHHQASSTHSWPETNGKALKLRLLQTNSLEANFILL